MKVKSESEVAQSYPTLSDPMDCSLPGSSVHRIFQAGVLESGAIAFSNMLSRLVITFLARINCDNLNLHIGEGNGNPLQYSCMENPLDQGAW